MGDWYNVAIDDITKNGGSAVLLSKMLKKKLGYKCMEDWYKVTKEDICKNGGNDTPNALQCSPSRALQSVYPEHSWEISRVQIQTTQVLAEQRVPTEILWPVA
jgi:hypothetical protein